MKKPSPYVLNEWMGMCERAGWAINGNCPLIEDEVILVMNKYIIDMESRIKSLEIIVSALSNQEENKHAIQDSIKTRIQTPRPTIVFSEQCNTQIDFIKGYT